MGLLDAFVQYVKDAMPGGLLNPEVGQHLQNVGNNIVAGHKRQDNVRKGLLSDPMNRELQKQAVRDGLDVAGMAPLGMTAWHGSPHKFDKFSLDKIGTGEGEQAYGHGLYLAESPEVAQTYKNVKATPTFEYNGKRGDFSPYKKGEISADEFMAWLGDRLPNLDPARRIEVAKSNLSVLGGDVRGRLTTGELAPITSPSFISEVESLAKNAKADDWKPMQSPSLYKTDIPDEAVARFLDWDKKLAEQAPEVRQAITKLARSNEDVMTAIQNNGMGDMSGSVLYSVLQDVFTKTNKRNAVIAGQDAAKWTHDDITKFANGNDSFASQQLQQYGVPGIRYLDGGSRGVGQGTSNFVVFSPDMIRILERNGQPTGLQPWAPGEYGLLGGVK